MATSKTKPTHSILLDNLASFVLLLLHKKCASLRSAQEILMYAGVENKQCVFLFNDIQVVFSQMLEDVNGILNSGDVPNLYGAEEIEKITDVCKPECSRKRIPATKLNIFSQFLIRVRKNIHVVLCMSPLGDAFRERLRMFPSLVNCCTIDWFSEWPDEALQSVATRSMSDGNFDLAGCQGEVVTFIKDLHMGVFEKSKLFLETLKRYNYVTPTSFLEVLNTYKSVLNAKRLEVGTLKSRLQNGLDKLISTADNVAVLQTQLREMEPVLVKTQGEVDEMIIHIGIEKEGAAETQTASATLIVQGEYTLFNLPAARSTHKANMAKKFGDTAEVHYDW